jgi:hypothetical protein
MTNKMGTPRTLGRVALIAGALIGASMLAFAADAPDAAPPAQPAAAAPVGSDVKIVFTVLPSTKKATVFWGKKRLGVIAPRQPLVVKRPRDSGPLDVIVRAEGCLPVQTRAYTFADTKLAVKVTPHDQKNTLLGYREELPPDGGVLPGDNPDGGVR